MDAAVQRGKAWRSSVSQNRGLPHRLAGPWTLMHTAKGTNQHCFINNHNIKSGGDYVSFGCCTWDPHSPLIMNPRFVAVSIRSRSVSGASTGLSSSPLSSPRVRTSIFLPLVYAFQLRNWTFSFSFFCLRSLFCVCDWADSFIPNQRDNIINHDNEPWLLISHVPKNYWDFKVTLLRGHHVLDSFHSCYLQLTAKGVHTSLSKLLNTRKRNQ